AVVEVPSDGAAQKTVAEAERHGRKLAGDGRIDGGVVTIVRRQSVRSKNRGQKFVVGDDLRLGNVDLAGLLVELLVGPERMLTVEQVREAVVFAQEQGLEGSQLN